MKNRINQSNKIEELKFENELKKIKLSLEHGAEFINLTDENIPAEIESEFLNHVEQFEKAQSESKRIQIYDFIGRPEYKALHSIPEAFISFELEGLLEILGGNQISIDSICEVDDAEMYRFITEELFFEETDDIRIEGMMHCFIYEEFHPNDDYDIRRTCSGLIETLFDKMSGLDSRFMDLADEIEIFHKFLMKEDFIVKVNEFRDSYSSINLFCFVMTAVHIEEARAHVRFEIEYSLKIEGTEELVCFSEQGELGLVKDFEFWFINRICIPGLNL